MKGFLFFFLIKMHSIQSRFVIGPWNILFAGVYVIYVYTFQPGNFTGWGSEGVIGKWQQNISTSSTKNCVLLITDHGKWKTSSQQPKGSVDKEYLTQTILDKVHLTLTIMDKEHLTPTTTESMMNKVTGWSTQSVTNFSRLLGHGAKKKLLIELFPTFPELS